MYNSSGLRGAVQKVTFLADMTAMGSHKKVIYLVAGPLREDTHKKKFFFLVFGPIRFCPPYPNGLVVLFFATSLIINANCFAHGKLDFRLQ